MRIERIDIILIMIVCPLVAIIGIGGLLAGLYYIGIPLLFAFSAYMLYLSYPKLSKKMRNDLSPGMQKEIDKLYDIREKDASKGRWIFVFMFVCSLIILLIYLIGIILC